MFPLLLFLLNATIAAAQDPAGQLQLAVDTPRVAVAPRSPGRAFVELPALEYRFVLEPRCADPARPASLSLSIADTRQRITLDAAESAARTVETVLRVPAAQLAPLPVSGFCERAQDPARSQDAPSALANAPRVLRIDAALSAQVSLLCVGPESEQRLWLARPLAVELLCEQPDPAGPAVETDGTAPR